MNRFLVIGSIVFPAYLFMMILAVLLLAVFGEDMEEELPPEYIMPVILALVLELISVAGLWFFIIYDIIHVVRNDRLSRGIKAAWICAIYCLNIFSIPIYALKYFRKPKPQMT